MVAKLDTIINNIDITYEEGINMAQPKEDGQKQEHI